MHIYYKKIIKYKKGRRKKTSETSPLYINILLYILLGYMCVCVYFFIDICSKTKMEYNYT